MKAIALCTMLAMSAGAAPEASGELFRHSPEWTQERLFSMLAVDDAYLWHDVLKGRAIHQNSSAVPPVKPLEGNFHTQQQGFFALMKLHFGELYPGHKERHLKDAKTLLDWVLDNGYDRKTHRFYFRYNEPRDEWSTLFYPEFNMITAAALYRFNAVRPSERYRQAADRVFDTITTLAWDDQHGGFMSGFKEDADTGQLQSEGQKTLYAAGYLALMMLDAYDSTGEERFLEWARRAVDPCNEHLWDGVHGAWYGEASRDWLEIAGTTKLTHVNADMIQANYRLYLLGQGEDYLQFAEEAMRFLIEHARGAHGLWHRHTNRDGSDPALPPGLNADGGAGTAKPYDRQMQAIVALCLGYRATGNRQYTALVDDTLEAMERTHRIDYEAGTNYGYMGKDNAQNTWCHLWGLKGFMAVIRLLKGG